MLETIREYALERLDASPEADGLRRQHASFFSAVAEQAYEHRFDAEAEWSARLELDHDDLRAALDFLAANDADGGLELAGALGWFWLSHGHLAEGRTRLASALAGTVATGRARARTLTAAGSLAGRLGDPREGRAQLDEGIGLWRELGDVGELAAALDSLGWLLVYDAGDDPGALAAFEQSVELRRGLGDGQGEVRGLTGVCQVLVAMGDTERAESLSRELLGMANGDLRSEHFAFHFLADCALLRDDCEEAERRYSESLRAAQKLGDVIETSLEVQGVAMSAAGLGDPRRALLLAGAVEALWESLGAAMSVGFWDALLERYIGSARAQLGADADAVWSEGRELTFDAAVELALEP